MVVNRPIAVSLPVGLKRKLPGTSMITCNWLLFSWSWVVVKVLEIGEGCKLASSVLWRSTSIRRISPVCLWQIMMVDHLVRSTYDLPKMLNLREETWSCQLSKGLVTSRFHRALFVDGGEDSPSVERCATVWMEDSDCFESCARYDPTVDVVLNDTTRISFSFLGKKATISTIIYWKLLILQLLDLDWRPTQPRFWLLGY